MKTQLKKLNKFFTDTSSANNSAVETEQRLAQIEAKLDNLINTVNCHHDHLTTLDSITKGLEQILSLAAENKSKHFENKSQEALDISFNPDYLLLENRFRGSEEDIKERVRKYLDIYLKNKPTKEIVEVGPGRGELQELFRENNLSSIGVELDEAMFLLCQKKKLNVVHADGLKFLANSKSDSFGGLIAIQVIEHLPYDVFKQFLDLTRDKGEKGGLVIFETINTESIFALCRNYFRDPTHANPMNPDTVKYCMELWGFKVLEIMKTSPFPRNVYLDNLDTDGSELDPLAKKINSNTEKINNLLFGNQDYAIIAEVV